MKLFPVLLLQMPYTLCTLDKSHHHEANECENILAALLFNMKERGGRERERGKGERETCTYIDDRQTEREEW